MRREEDVSLFLLNGRKMGENVGGKVKEVGRRDQKIEGREESHDLESGPQIFPTPARPNW